MIDRRFRAAASSMTPARVSCGRSASVNFPRTDMSGMMPSSLRSSEAKPDAASDGVLRLPRGETGGPSSQERPARGRGGAEEHPRGFGAAGSEQAREADDFPLADVERNVMNLVAGARWVSSVSRGRPMCALAAENRCALAGPERRLAPTSLATNSTLLMSSIRLGSPFVRRA